MTEFVAVIRKVEGTDYWIDIPDIPGCISSGETIEAAKANLREAIAMHMEVQAPPEAARAESALTEDDLEDAVGTYIINL